MDILKGIQTIVNPKGLMPRGNLSIINNVQRHRGGIEKTQEAVLERRLKDLEKKHNKVMAYLKKLDGLFKVASVVRKKILCLA